MDIEQKIKYVRPSSLPIPRIEALALPIIVERANMQKPHVEYDTLPMTNTRVLAIGYIHIHKASTVCHILDYDSKLPDFYASRKCVK